MQIVSKTDTGLVRDENQDRVLYTMLDDSTAFVIVCDGMGGENAGSEASDIAVNAVFNRVTQNYRSEADSNSLRNLLFSALTAANIMVHDRSLSDESKIGMGTTCVCGIIKNNIAHICNVGDSRAYIYHNDEILQISKDHTYVQLLFEKGEIDEEEMKIHEQRNMITKAVGIEDEISPDYFEIAFGGNDIILFCSDGLSGFCSEEQMVSALRNTKDIDRAADELVKYALDEGGRDNITVALVTNSIGQESNNG